MLLPEKAKRIEFVDYRPKGDLVSVFVYDCLGGCGKEIRSQKGSLKRRTGLCVRCIKRSQHRPYWRLFRSMVTSAKRSGHAVDITFEEFLFLTQITVCYYCGGSITWEPYGGTAYNLDRLNSALGYSFENVAVCCFRCNNLKSNFFDSEEFKAIMKVHEIRTSGSKKDWNELVYYLVSWKDEMEFLL